MSWGCSYFVPNGGQTTLTEGTYGMIHLDSIPSTILHSELVNLFKLILKESSIIVIQTFRRFDNTEHLPSTAIIILKNLAQTRYWGAYLHDFVLRQTVINCIWFDNLEILVPSFNLLDMGLFERMGKFAYPNQRPVQKISRAPAWISPPRCRPINWRQECCQIDDEEVCRYPAGPRPEPLSRLITRFECFLKLPAEMRLCKTSDYHSLHLS